MFFSNNKCIKIDQNERNFAEAVRECSTIKFGSLAVVETDEELNIFMQKLNTASVTTKAFIKTAKIGPLAKKDGMHLIND